MSGFEKRTMPLGLFEKVRAFLDANDDHAREEHVAGGYLRNATTRASDVVELPDPLRREIQATLRSTCEEWCGQALEPTSVYGIRRYYRGTTLAVHCDRSELVISAILNIAQDVEEPWPLVIEEDGLRQQCFLQPGEMLLYEGARLPHGRPDPLVGTHYCNVFVHYQPKPASVHTTEPTAFKVFPAALSDEMCDRIVGEATTTGLPETHWVNGTLRRFALLANDAVWAYDTAAIGRVQFAVDDESHASAERPSGRSRTLSVIANLSGPDDYEGGDLQLTDASGHTVFSASLAATPVVAQLKRRGTVIVVPGYLQPVFQPVTAGVRRSLVSWPVATPRYVPYLTPQFWQETRLDPLRYDTFIETGSYRGETLDFMKDRFRSLHSIELSKRWHDFCAARFRDYPHIHLHHGDSTELLPRVLNGIDRPVIVFLDAHYSGGSTAKAGSTVDSPLLEELAYLRTRTADDIIIVDDTSFLGAKGGHEPERVDDDQIWPEFAYDWSGIGRAQVLSSMKPGYRLLENRHSRYTLTPREDQWILFPPAR